MPGLLVNLFSTLGRWLGVSLSPLPLVSSGMVASSDKDDATSEPREGVEFGYSDGRAPAAGDTYAVSFSKAATPLPHKPVKDEFYEVALTRSRPGVGFVGVGQGIVEVRYLGEVDGKRRVEVARVLEWKDGASTLYGVIEGVAAPSKGSIYELPSKGDSIEDPYLEAIVWETMHPSSIGQKGFDPPKKKSDVKVGETVYFALREKNPLGRAVLATDGVVQAAEEGDYDDELRVWTTGSVLKKVRATEDLALPKIVFVEVGNLIDPPYGWTA